MKKYLIFLAFLGMSACSKKQNTNSYISFRFNKIDYKFEAATSYQSAFDLTFDHRVTMGGHDAQLSSNYIAMKIAVKSLILQESYVVLVLNGQYYKSWGVSGNGSIKQGVIMFDDHEDPSNHNDRIGTFSGELFPVNGTTNYADDTIIGESIKIQNGAFRMKG